MSARRDLSSLYRLEFYKKQKYWKFCTPRKDDKSQKQQKCGKEMPLNVTYNIEDNDTDNPSDPHNMAFISSEPVERTTSDTNISSSSTKRLSLQRLQPINVYPDFETQKQQSQSPKEMPLSNGVGKRLAALQEAANSYKDINNNVEEVQDMDITENWSQQQSYDLMLTEDAAQGADYVDGDGDGRSQATCLCHETDIVVVAGAAFGSDGNCSMDSEGEFMRGAHAAPHSSEIDLSLSSIATDMSCKDLSCLSVQQLSAAAFHHTIALRRLFLESRLRQSLKRNTSFPTDYNLPSDCDNIVAGSHLQEMMARERDWVHSNLFD